MFGSVSCTHIYIYSLIVFISTILSDDLSVCPAFVYPAIIKHDVLNNHPFSSMIFPFKPPFSRGCSILFEAFPMGFPVISGGISAIGQLPRFPILGPSCRETWVSFLSESSATRWTMTVWISAGFEEDCSWDLMGFCDVNLGGVCRILWDCTGFSGVSVAIEPTGRGIYMEIPSSKLYTVIAMDNGPFNPIYI